MAPTYSSFAVAGGAGGLGKFIVDELVALGGPEVAVTVLSRSPDTSVPASVTVKAVDYADEDSIASALSGIDVVVSTLNGAGIAAQPALARAAKKAGVKLFVTSDFGMPTLDLEPGSPLAIKGDIHTVLKDLELPYVSIFSGVFTDIVFSPYFGFDFANNKAKVVGKGNTPASFTSRRDIARFLAHALTAFPASKLENTIFRIQGDLKTLNEVVGLYEATHPGSKVEVTHTPVEDAEKIVKEKPGPATMLQYYSLKLEYGSDSGEGGKYTLSNELWKEWNPVPVKDVLEKL